MVGFQQTAQDRMANCGPFLLSESPAAPGPRTHLRPPDSAPSVPPPRLRPAAGGRALRGGRSPRRAPSPVPPAHSPAPSTAPRRSPRPPPPPPGRMAAPAAPPGGPALPAQMCEAGAGPACAGPPRRGPPWPRVQGPSLRPSCAGQPRGPHRASRIRSSKGVAGSGVGRRVRRGGGGKGRGIPDPSSASCGSAAEGLPRPPQ